MAGYIIARIKVTDPEQYEEYKKLSRVQLRHLVVNLSYAGATP